MAMGSSELWRQCVEWLVDCGALPANHRSRQSNADVFDLAQTLRDGVVLCKLLNMIYPGCLENVHINLNSQLSQFLCLQNIRAFINVLEVQFGIPKQFDAVDLYHMTNFPMVLHCLSQLSNTPHASSKFNPFPYNYRASAYIESENEDIYKLLPDLASERDLADEEEDLYDVVPEEKEEEGIYGSIIGIQQSVPLTKSDDTTDSSAPIDKRSYCINEISETESNYVTHLRMMKNEFIDKLNLHEEQKRKMFINIEQLLPIHESFKKEIERLRNDMQNAKFSQLFIKYKEKLLCYGEYCSKMTDAQDFLDEMMNNDNNFRRRIEECQMRMSQNKFKLRELLCVPMQRVLKYVLLARELLKNTPDSHHDKSGLQEGVQAMQELSAYVNEVKRDNEELIKINQIESSIQGYESNIRVPLNTYGRVRKDGELKIKFTNEAPKLRNVFLFDRAILITKLKNDMYILKEFVSLDEMKLDEMPNSGGRAKWSCCWSLNGATQGRIGSTFFAKTQSEKNKWIDGLKTALEYLHPRALRGKTHNFAMHTFSGPSYCDVCKKLLKGTFYQGYKCKVTQVSCHKDCLSDALSQINNNNYSTKHKEEDTAPPVPSRGRQTKNMNLPLPPASATKEPVRNTSAPYYQAIRDYMGNPTPPPFNGPVRPVTFNMGEKIEVIQQVNSEWWFGKCLSNLESGYFPASYVSFPTSAINESYESLDYDMQTRQPKKPNYMTAQPIKHSNSSTKQTPTSVQNTLPLEDLSWRPASNPSIQSQSMATSPPPRPPKTRLSMDNFFKIPAAKSIPSFPEILQQNDWFANNCDRPTAEGHLQGKPTGTFLVREKDNSRALSIVFGSDIKHIKIHKTNDSMFFVAECRNFRSIEALVQYYEENSLSASFLGLETCLRFSYRDPVMFPNYNETMSPTSPSQNQIIDKKGRCYDVIGQAYVLYDFEPRSAQELSLKAGEIVLIISKKGSSHGWWKGEFNGEVGYFPKTFVEER